MGNTEVQQNKVQNGKTHRYNRTKYRVRKHTGTAEQSTEWENTQTQQTKVQDGQTHRRSKLNYRMGKHTGTAS